MVGAAQSSSKSVESITKSSPKLAELLRRGSATKYRKSRNELNYIGMPVGGINCGTVYLGGDGRLWLWDIFNEPKEGIEPKTLEWRGMKVRSSDGSAYIEPAHDVRPVEQGFMLRVRRGPKTLLVRSMRASDWPEVEFEATYPLATVRYRDPSAPVEVQLEAFAPFIPLDDLESNLPATIQSFRIRNRNDAPIEIELVGWLENAANKFTAKDGDGERRNRMVSDSGYQGVAMDFVAALPSPEKQRDGGSLCIAVLGEGRAIVDLPLEGQGETDPITVQHAGEEARSAPGKPILGAAAAARALGPGEAVTLNFVISWNFPNVDERIGQKVEDALGGHFYTTRFKDAAAVVAHIGANFDKLSTQTRLWHRTWYDATLPWWFMERSFASISTLATTTSQRFASGRLWAWEGVGCGKGTCLHVWQYAQAMARIFPALERDSRERVDLGVALKSDGSIGFRAEFDMRPAIDGQAGTVLRFYREHQMSEDSSFLKRNWPNIKRTIQFLLSCDRNGDGMEDTPLENTLDAVWDGEIAWIVGLCIAGVEAGGRMAREMGDSQLAERCADYVRLGRANMTAKLFNGEYFIHRPDPKVGRRAIGTYNTCHIDQVYGQSWAFQAGLGRVLDRAPTLSALRALWKYNFFEDVGPFLDMNGHGRPYALPGDSGMVMTTNARHEAQPFGENVTWQGGYFYECMTGFEYQVAAHMMAEGMVEESLRLTRAIHDRYHAAKRNPFNEIEYGDHYARAMASYGVFISACGFEYHGPRGYMAFAPKIRAEDFRAPFTAAQGWGTYAQRGTAKRQEHRLSLASGSLTLRSFAVEMLGRRSVREADLRVGTQRISSKLYQDGERVRVEFDAPIVLHVGDTLMLAV